MNRKFENKLEILRVLTIFIFLENNFDKRKIDFEGRAS